MPQPQRQEQSQVQIVHPAGPTFIKIPDDVASDTTLADNEKLMISLILSLSRNTTIQRARASWAYLAWRLGKADEETAKRTVLRINAKYTERRTSWRIGIRYRRGHANLTHVIVPQHVLISWRKPVASEGGPPARALQTPPARARPYKSIRKEQSQSRGEAAAGTLFDTQPLSFNLLRASHAGGDIVKRLLEAIAGGEVLYVHTESGWRLIERATALEGYPGIRLELAVEGQIDVTEPMEIDALQLGAVRFGC